MMLELFLPQSSLGPVPGKIRNGKNGMSCPKAIDSVSDKTSRRASFLILRKRLIWGLALSLQSLFCFEYETNGYFIVTCNWPKVTASTSLGIQESMSKQPCPTCGRKIHQKKAEITGNFFNEKSVVWNYLNGQKWLHPGLYESNELFRSF